RFVAVDDITHVEAQGDYARLHTARGSHLVRIPLSTLEERWRSRGFVRIHRRHLVALGHIGELRLDAGTASVLIGTEELQVSRRHARELRDLLMRRTAGSRRTTPCPRTPPSAAWSSPDRPAARAVPSATTARAPRSTSRPPSATPTCAP